ILITEPSERAATFPDVLEDDLSFRVATASKNPGSNRRSFPPRGLLFAAADGARANGKEVNMFSDFFRRMHITVLTRHEDGQTMAEFTRVLPILCVLLFGILEFGIVWNHYVTLTDAVRAGARKAAVSRPLGASGAVAAAQQAVINASGDLDQSKLPAPTV